MNEGLQLKAALLAHARRETETAITTVQSSLAGLEASLTSETKSSAGDKFETGRAMVHMEQQKLTQQLSNLGERMQALGRMESKAATELVAEGSLVATNRGLYLVGLGLGKVLLGGRTIFCTSLESPIGMQLIGKRVGEMFKFNELEFLVKGMI